jgi:Double-GTPase 2
MIVAVTCEKADCTVATTGTCLLSQPNPSECPHYRAKSASPASQAQEVKPQESEPEPPPVDLSATARRASRTFHAGIELGTVDAADIMKSRYGHVIAVLGSTDVGKTCFLCSLYLMASNAMLPSGYLFAGSQSLQAFEDRARGLREWKDGKLAKQLVDHTHLDTRQPSLLHLGLREASGERRRFDLLLTDLPGEWTDNLVKKASAADAFKFLARADGIIVVVDGKLLMADETRHAVQQEMIYFVDRLAGTVGVSKVTPFVLWVSKSDEIDKLVPPAATELAAHIEQHGYHVTVISAAAFSRSPAKVENGMGVFNAIETILRHQDVQGINAASEIPATRAFGRFRG